MNFSGQIAIYFSTTGEKKTLHEWANDRGITYCRLYLILHLINKHNLI